MSKESKFPETLSPYPFSTPQADQGPSPKKPIPVPQTSAPKNAPPQTREQEAEPNLGYKYSPHDLENAVQGHTMVGGISGLHPIAEYIMPTQAPASQTLKPSIDNYVDPDTPTTVVPPKRDDTAVGALDFRESIENNPEARAVYVNPAVKRMKEKAKEYSGGSYLDIDVPRDLQTRIQAPPDHELLFEQFKDYVRNQESGFYTHFDADSMRILGKGGCSLIVRLKKKADYSSVDDTVDMSAIPDEVAVKLEYSSGLRPLQDVKREREMQKLAAELTGNMIFPDQSYVLPVFDTGLEGENTFSYKRPPSFDAELRGEISDILSEKGVFTHRQIAKMADVLLDYHIEDFVMPVAKGIPLDQYLEKVPVKVKDADGNETIEMRSPLSDKETIQLFGEILDTVSDLHDGYLVHRDLKPQNILVREEMSGNEIKRRIELIDCGLAARVGDNTVSNGTVTYMGISQATIGVAMPQNDIQSLGIILYEMIAGFNPRQSNQNVAHPSKHQEYIADMFHKIQTTPPDIGDSSITGKDVSPMVGAVIMKAVRPESVYSTCRELAVDLQAAVEGCTQLPSISYRQKAAFERPDEKIAYPRLYIENGRLMAGDTEVSPEDFHLAIKASGMTWSEYQELQNDEQRKSREFSRRPMMVLGHEKDQDFDYDKVYRPEETFARFGSDNFEITKGVGLRIESRKFYDENGMKYPSAAESINHVTDPRGWFTSSVQPIHSQSEVRALNAAAEAEAVINYFNNGGLAEDIAQGNKDLIRILASVVPELRTSFVKKDSDDDGSDD